MASVAQMLYMSEEKLLVQDQNEKSSPQRYNVNRSDDFDENMRFKVRSLLREPTHHAPQILPHLFDLQLGLSATEGL